MLYSLNCDDNLACWIYNNCHMISLRVIDVNASDGEQAMDRWVIGWNGSFLDDHVGRGSM